MTRPRTGVQRSASTAGTDMPEGHGLQHTLALTNMPAATATMCSTGEATAAVAAHPAPSAMAVTPRYSPPTPSRRSTVRSAVPTLECSCGRWANGGGNSESTGRAQHMSSMSMQGREAPLAGRQMSSCSRLQPALLTAPFPFPHEITCCPGCASACMRVLIVSTGYMATCSPMPATAPATMCCGTKHSGRQAQVKVVMLSRQPQCGGKAGGALHARQAAASSVQAAAGGWRRRRRRRRRAGMHVAARRRTP